MIKEYIAYLKDNPKGYWFRRKLFGWGWVPAKWQGWAVTAVYLLTALYFFSRIDVSSLIIATVAMFFICYVKGEKLRWQWGSRTRSESHRSQ